MPLATIGTLGPSICIGHSRITPPCDTTSTQLGERAGVGDLDAALATTCEGERRAQRGPRRPVAPRPEAVAGDAAMPAAIEVVEAGD